MCQRLVPVILQELPGSWSPDHPLHIGLPREDFLEFHVECCGQSKTVEEEIFGAILRGTDSSLYHSQANIFVTVHVLPDISSDIETSDFLSLYVTSWFLRHYGFEYNEVVCFRTVICFPIEKVVFGAKNSRSFEWSKTSKWHEKLLLSTCNKKTLCRVGDVLLIPPAELMLDNASLLFDFVALECLPFGQGILTTGTTVVIIDDSENSSYFENDFEQSQTDRGEVCLYSDMISYLHLMNYTSSLLLQGAVRSTCFNVNPLVKSITTSHSLLKVLRNRFQVQIIPKLTEDFREALSNVPCICDPVNTVFLTKSALERLGIGSSTWVKIKLVSSWRKKVRRCSSTPVPCEALPADNVSIKHRRSSGSSDGTKEGTKNYRMATVCCLPSSKNSSYHVNDEMSYVSPHLWFNLNLHPSNLLQPSTQLMVEAILHEDKDSLPPYANEVYIALIQSPDYNGNISCSGILHKYFEIPRYVCKGDILSISSKDDLTLHQKMDDPLSNKWPVIYFRVSMIEGPASSSGFLADKSHTRLYQSGTTQSFIPVTMSAYYGLSVAHPLWNNPMPAGLAQYVEMVQELVVPFLKLQNKKLQVNSNILVSGPLGCGKTVVVKAVAKCLNLHLYEINCYEFLGESPAVVEGKLKAVIEKASVYVPCIMLLKNIHYIGKEKELKSEDPRVLNSLNELLKNINSSGSDWPVITVATTSETKLLSRDVSLTFLHHVNMEPPNEQERSMIISDLLSSCCVGNEVSIPYLAQRTAGFVLGDLSLLVVDGARIAFSRVKKKLMELGLTAEGADALLAGVPVVQEDLLSSLEKLQSSVAESIGAPEVPNVRWEDIGGLSEVKQEILDTIQLPLEHPEIVTSGLQRSGVLLYGPPGTGKTLLAKAVATECSLNFLSVKGPELINMYVGQSEENIREVFSRARGASPCVIFFDELDSLAPNRGKSGDSGGVMDRVVSQLLAELDGLNKAADVFVIGATNRPDLIDPALLRPGRFDRHLFVGIPEDKISRVNILKALTRKFCLAEDIDFEVIEGNCPPNLSGADFYSLCTDAVMNKIQKSVELIENGQLHDDNIELVVDSEDFEVALKSLSPSVTPEELARYRQTKFLM